MTNDELARLFHRIGPMPQPGQYSAPWAAVIWDGFTLVMQPTGTPLDAETAAAWPLFARHCSMQELATEPTIERLVADYAATLAGREALPQADFLEHLAACRACDWWNEAGRSGCGACDCVSCPCTRRLLWWTGETCPKGRWGLKQP